MTIPSVTIDATGLHKPTFNAVFAALQDAYRGVYGSDISLDPSTQDGQWLGIIASALDDANAAVAAAYAARSPLEAQGAGLSSVVKLNGIARLAASYSTCPVKIIGQAGTVISGGLISDTQNANVWALPATVNIPAAGEVTVTATCQTLGAIAAAPGALTTIRTTTAGWQSVTNLVDATPGAPVETDAELRVRQSVSAAMPAIGQYEALIAAVAAIPGVSRYAMLVNEDGGTTFQGIPGHSVAIVVQGGDVQTVADTIALKKSAGVGTWGTTTVGTTPDAQGFSRPIRFSPVVSVPLKVTFALRAKSGFTSDVLADVKQSLVDWATALPIGEAVPKSDAYGAARLWHGANSSTYTVDINTLTVTLQNGTTPTPPAGFSGTDLYMDYYQAPSLALADIVVTVV